MRSHNRTGRPPNRADGLCFTWSRLRDLNPGPVLYKGVGTPESADALLDWWERQLKVDAVFECIVGAL